jgi:protein TonB
VSRDLLPAAVAALALHAAALYALKRSDPTPPQLGDEDRPTVLVFASVAPDATEPVEPTGAPVPETEQETPPAPERVRAARAPAPRPESIEPSLVAVRTPPSASPAGSLVAPAASSEALPATVLARLAPDAPAPAGRIRLPVRALPTQPLATPTGVAMATRSDPPRASPPDLPASGGAPVTTPPVAVRNDPPAYPRIAWQRGDQGVVELRIEVLADGRCGSVTVRTSSGHSILDRAAEKAARRWRFRPATRDGVPVDFWIEIPVEFDLEG